MRTSKEIESLVNCIETLSMMNGKINSRYVEDSNTLDVKPVLVALSKHYGVKVKLASIKLKKIRDLNLPLVFKSMDGCYCILAKMNENQAMIMSPSRDHPEVISKEDLAAIWQGEVVFCDYGQNKFNLNWFVPAFVRHRNLLYKVLLFSFTLQFLALISPLFFQVVMDKVLVHSALSTLDVLVMVLVIVGIYEVVLRSFREYIFSHTTNRVDICLGGKLFTHLISLPLLYFKSRQAGSIVARVRELDSIRDFLTSSAMTLLVDIAFSVVFLLVMSYLSLTLTYIVLATIPLYVILSWVTGKRLHLAVQRQFHCSAKNASFLMESVYAIQTIKSLALEPVMQRRWFGQVQEFVATSVNTQNIN
ncbi:ABC transporter transmembrane domain-containing protein, partial [Aeromonas jandaei]|uniref:ABC transporter transmembrane domain-containing protein n=1 Tax=Aeromonas jandaei TaxID=650 RepID=UPI002AA0D9CE